jgi:hypothetical protein
MASPALPMVVSHTSLRPGVGSRPRMPVNTRASARRPQVGRMPHRRERRFDRRMRAHPLFGEKQRVGLAVGQRQRDDLDPVGHLVALHECLERFARPFVRLERDDAPQRSDTCGGEHGEVADVGANVHEHVSGPQRRGNRMGDTLFVRRSVKIRITAGRVGDVELQHVIEHLHHPEALVAPPQATEEALLDDPVEAGEQARAASCGPPGADGQRFEGGNRGDGGRDGCRHCVAHTPGAASDDVRPVHGPAGSSVRTATSGGQLIRTGT